MSTAMVIEFPSNFNRLNNKGSRKKLIEVHLTQQQLLEFLTNEQKEEQAKQQRKQRKKKDKFHDPKVKALNIKRKTKYNEFVKPSKIKEFYMTESEMIRYFKERGWDYYSGNKTFEEERRLINKLKLCINS